MELLHLHGNLSQEVREEACCLVAYTTVYVYCILSFKSGIYVGMYCSVVLGLAKCPTGRSRKIGLAQGPQHRACGTLLTVFSSKNYCKADLFPWLEKKLPTFLANFKPELTFFWSEIEILVEFFGVSDSDREPVSLQ